eukprot:4692354-Ditylum_brightwellii.AAC.1
MLQDGIYNASLGWSSGISDSFVSCESSCSNQNGFKALHACCEGRALCFCGGVLVCCEVQ